MNGNKRQQTQTATTENPNRWQGKKKWMDGGILELMPREAVVSPSWKIYPWKYWKLDWTSFWTVQHNFKAGLALKRSWRTWSSEVISNQNYFMHESLECSLCKSVNLFSLWLKLLNLLNAEYDAWQGDIIQMLQRAHMNVFLAHMQLHSPAWLAIQREK